LSIPHGEQESGRRFLVENYDPLGALAYWRHGELDLRAWLTSVRGVNETAWFASDDLRPFGLMCLRMGWRLATRPLAGHAAKDGSGERPNALVTGARRKPSFVAPIRQYRWTRSANRGTVQGTTRKEAVRV
ncbi:MAG TPA: hypothetical protein VED63_11505, partial [Acidimicrobiales bacterium]|nr:hypothetical protein [Acidimicrobiales bacterium]